MSRLSPFVFLVMGGELRKMASVGERLRRGRAILRSSQLHT
jgi:hypothetical protein